MKLIFFVKHIMKLIGLSFSRQRCANLLYTIEQSLYVKDQKKEQSHVFKHRLLPLTIS
jgi:hypothetical protein